MKKVIAICVLAFLLGCGGGGIAAFASHQNGAGTGIGEMYDQWKISKFIDEQEEERPGGLAESKIQTGSKYTGITYNAPAQKTVEKQDVAEPEKTDSVSETKRAEKTGILSGIVNRFGKKEEVVAEAPAVETVKTTKQGRIAIQSGSLNVRDAGSTDGKIIGQVRKDDLVEILEQEGAWYKVVTNTGISGYVSAKYVEILQ